MNTLWNELSQGLSPALPTSAPQLADLGQPAAELTAASTGNVLAPLAHLALIRADGEDAESFLHSQLTADIKNLKAGQLTHAAWCTAKGRMLASFLVWRVDGGFRLLLADDLVEPVLKRLQMFVLRAKVKLSAGNDRLVLGFSGPQASQLAGHGDDAVQSILTGDGPDATTTLRLSCGRCLCVADLATTRQRWTAAGASATPVGTTAWQWLDIRAAFPLVTAATREEFVPQMADFEKIGGVSFHKGCYPGQEIVARTQYLGKVKRHLFRLESSVPLAAGDEIHSPENPDQSVGRVMTATPAPGGGYHALAVAQSGHAQALRLGKVDGPALAATAVNP